MELGLSGRVIAITGGSSGIGFSTAKMLLAEGAVVAICGRDAAKLESARDELNASSERLLVAQGDVTDARSMEAFSVAIERSYGVLDGVVLNAGRSRFNSFETTTDEMWLEELELKFFGLIRPLREFLPLLGQSSIASVVVTNSLLAKQPEPHLVATSAARGGQFNLCKSLANEFAPQGIRVNSVLLGTVESAQWQRRYAQLSSPKPSYDQWLLAEAERRHIPLQRFGKPQEIAAAILFLLSPLSGYITGSSIECSGGVGRQP